MQKAAIDRIDEGIAVLLLGEAEQELYVPLAQLPPGAKAGDWLRVTVVSGQLQRAEPDLEETRRRRERIRAKLDKLLG